MNRAFRRIRIQTQEFTANLSPRSKSFHLFSSPG